MGRAAFERPMRIFRAIEETAEANMLARLFDWGKRGRPSAPFYRPYGQQSADFLYNLLFCDNPDLYRNGKQDTGPLGTVLSGAATRASLEKITVDPAVESRVRMLAFNRLRAMN